MMKITIDNDTMDLRPTKIVAVARNYRAHAREMGSETPAEPKIFLKPPSSLIGDGEAVILPPSSKRVDHEVELAAIMERRCSHVGPEEALSNVLGYSIVIDMTARDIQAEAKKAGMPWTVAKGFDTFAPIGPRIVKREELDLNDLDIWLKVNNEFRQRGRTGDMIFSLGELISHISKIMTLEPQDIIATGTPEGVGHVRPGDEIEAGIEGIGTLRISVRRREG